MLAAGLGLPPMRVATPVGAPVPPPSSSVATQQAAVAVPAPAPPAAAAQQPQQQPQSAPAQVAELQQQLQRMQNDLQQQAGMASQLRLKVGRGCCFLSHSLCRRARLAHGHCAWPSVEPLTAAPPSPPCIPLHCS
jgi:hypothetical protein